MAYATLAQVQSEFKNLSIGASTPITTTEAERFIEESDALIDSYLSRRYEVPITGSNSLKVVREISIMLTAHRIKEILRVKTGDSKADQDGRGNSLHSRAMNLLKDIVKRKLNLTDATAATADDGVSSYVSSNDVPFIFERGTDQW